MRAAVAQDEAFTVLLDRVENILHDQPVCYALLRITASRRFRDEEPRSSTRAKGD
jgi:hypothetical protein